MKIIRKERREDQNLIFAVNAAAFETEAEAKLVDELREKASPIISLVAELEGNIIGHIMFSPVEIEGYGEIRAMGLAPMAVMPTHQKKGFGSALVQAGLDACRKKDVDVIIVLGHPGYYPRFGFKPAEEFGISSQWDVPAGVFMLIELKEAALQNISSTARYHPIFDELQ